MIEIKVKELSASNNDFADVVTVATCNATAKGFAEKVKELIKDEKCPDHPNAKQTIYIIANREQILQVDKSSLCCPKFRNSIQINIKP